jgi:hypothetical protein
MFMCIRGIKYASVSIYEFYIRICDRPYVFFFRFILQKVVQKHTFLQLYPTELFWTSNVCLFDDI